MEILSAEIDWRFGWGNTPDLKVYVDKLPNFESKVHHIQKNGMIHCFDGDICTFMYMGQRGIETGNSSHMGYGGSVFERLLDTGETIKSNNCWSGRAASLEIISVDVALYERDGKYPNMGYHGFALKVAKFDSLIKELGAFSLVQRKTRDDNPPIRWRVISNSPDKESKPEPSAGFKRNY